MKSNNEISEKLVKANKEIIKATLRGFSATFNAGKVRIMNKMQGIDFTLDREDSASLLALYYEADLPELLFEDWLLQTDLEG